MNNFTGSTADIDDISNRWDSHKSWQEFLKKEFLKNKEDGIDIEECQYRLPCGLCVVLKTDCQRK